MTITASTQTQSISVQPGIASVLRSATAAAVGGATLLYGYGAAVIAIGGPLEASDPGADRAVPVLAANFAMGVVFCTVIATVIAVGLARRATHPSRSFIRTAIALTAVSLVAPLAASHTLWSTRLILSVGHVIAALIVIPVITHSLRGPEQPSAQRS